MHRLEWLLGLLIRDLTASEAKLITASAFYSYALLVLSVGLIPLID